MKREDREKLRDVMYLIRDTEYILRDAKRIIREARKSSDFRVTQDMLDYAEHVHNESINLVDSIE